MHVASLARHTSSTGGTDSNIEFSTVLYKPYCVQYCVSVLVHGNSREPIVDRAHGSLHFTDYSLLYQLPCDGHGYILLYYHGIASHTIRNIVDYFRVELYWACYCYWACPVHTVRYGSLLQQLSWHRCGRLGLVLA